MAKRPTKKITTFRISPDIMKLLSAKAAKQHISRSKLVELVLVDYLNDRGARTLGSLVGSLKEDAPDDRQVDLFA